MAISMELYELKNLCRDMARLGAAEFERMTAPAKDMISQREAYRLFREVRVKRWLAEGIVSTQRNGSASNSKRYYSRAELITADNAEKLKTIINR